MFKELEPADLDYLGIRNAEHRAKLLAAVQLLHAIDSAGSDEIAESSSENEEIRLNLVQKKNSFSPFGRRHFPRDSGCYEGSLMPNLNSIQSNVDATFLNDMLGAQCSNDIFKRVETERISTNNHQTHHESVLKKGFVKKGLLGGAGDDNCSRGEGGALSEKSSDSGVSSSSLSGPIKNNL